MLILQAYVDISFCPNLKLYKGKCPVGWLTKFFGASVSWESTVTRRVKTKEAQELGEIDVRWIDTESQLADSLTKATVGTKLAEHRNGILGPDELQTHFGPPMIPP